MTSNGELNLEENPKDLPSSERGENRRNSEVKPDDSICDGSNQNSPRGVLEIPISSADSDGSSSSGSEPSAVDRTIAPDGLVLESHSLQWRTLIGGLILRKKRTMMRLSTFPPATAGLGLRRTPSEKDRIESVEITAETGRGRPSWRSFDHQELAAATNNFSSGSKEGLEWKVRFKIALGIAEGLLYLHEGCQRRIIHRDIKASNILLTEDFQPQISDFGLAKWLPDKWTHHIVFPIEGTFGYLAPEYFMHGVVNEKIDVFAFGVLLLELITGRRAVDSSRQSLVIWAKPLLDANNVKQLADPSLGDAYDAEEMRRALLVASMCIHHLSTSRPDMNWVVRLLKGEEGSAELMGRELRPKLARPPQFDACDSEDYTCSRYLNDLHRHKQLALEQ
ncbi:receptor-like cytosolic serine/threonine-protein kinase RBK1 isoform X4 [Elaeis guineensis]|uniref:receptor-like cytosolic serine/threonine-protein kinase RBK1 isoform X4 n=1 Tax=Elaeis guineensis var. tenera TaxID=51953 RepID=UPI003C6D39D6